jgi:hypothetical protein
MARSAPPSCDFFRLGLLADRLRPLRPAKGYDFTAFDDTFAHYLPDTGSQSATPRQPNEINELSGFQSATPKYLVAVQKPSNTLKTNDCRGVALSKGESGEIEKSDGKDGGGAC